MNEIPQIIKNDELNSNVVDARELHEKIEIGKDFSTWIKDKVVNNENFVKDLDYTEISLLLKIKQPKRGGRKRKDYTLTLETALHVLQKSKNTPQSTKIQKYIIEYLTNQTVFIEDKREEMRFGDMLDGITNIKWERQYPIPKGNGLYYYVDFYLNGVIVEYDEEHHKYRTNEDTERMMFIIKYLTEKRLNYDSEYAPPTLIRVEKGKEYLGIRSILSHFRWNKEDVLDFIYTNDNTEIGSDRYPRIDNSAENILNIEYLERTHKSSELFSLETLLRCGKQI